MRQRHTGVRSRITGATFGEDATLLRRSGGTRDSHGEWVQGALVETAIRVTALPPGGPETWTELQRMVEQGGVRRRGSVDLLDSDRP